MKKIIITIVSLAMILFCTSCSSKEERWQAKAVSWLEEQLETEDTADYLEVNTGRIQIRSHDTIKIIIESVKNAEDIGDVTGHYFQPTEEPIFYIGDVCIGTSSIFAFYHGSRIIQFIHPQEQAEILYELGDKLRNNQ